jgi:hypothetical protein
MRIAAIALAGVLVVCTCLLVWRWTIPHKSIPDGLTPSVAMRPPASVKAGGSATNVYAHNLRLHKGERFRIYVRWFRGQMVGARRGVVPSFDDQDSFYLNVKSGVIRANIGDIGNLMNDSAASAHSPLKDMTLSGDGDLIHLRGTLHKVIPIPVELVGQISAAPNNVIHVHVTKLNVLKIPFKGLLGFFHVHLSDLFDPHGVAGITVNGNDIYLDTVKLLPPPHIRGDMTSVRVVNPDLETVFGNAQGEVTRMEQWRNFLRLRGGTIDFGKLTMHQVDIVMVDISNDAWFDLDLAHYQEQMVYGYTHITPQAGLQIFMPDIDTLPKKKAQSINLEWMKHRNEPPPPDIFEK